MIANPFAPELHGVTWEDPPAVNVIRKARLTWLDEALAAAPSDRIRIGGCVMCRGGTRSGALNPPLAPYMLSVPVDVPRIKIEVHTLRWGDADWMRECVPTLDAWCARHEIPLIVTSEWDASYPDPKFCEVDMLRSFLAGDSDWMFYVDADIVVHPLAPFPYFGESGFYIREDTHGRSNKRWFEWCREKFGRVPDPDYLYRNAGVWACDREAARRMLEVIETPYHEGIMEQDQWNWWISHAVAKGMELHTLPHEWNRFPREVRPSWFFHIYSKAKMFHLERFRQAGLLPDGVKRIDNRVPEVPDFGEGAVVWPWLSTAAPWEDLWFSHRSVLAHWSEKWPLVLVGDACPEWWPGKFIKASGYDDALWISVQCARRTLLMNDDIFMLQNQSPEDLAIARHGGDAYDRMGEYMVAENTWKRGLGQVLMRCHHHGRGTLDFSTHTPYLFERDKAREVLDVFGCFYKIPFETAYFNWHRVPSAPCVEKAVNVNKLGGAKWINVERHQYTDALRSELEQRWGIMP